jgi:hypothetical protein
MRSTTGFEGSDQTKEGLFSTLELVLDVLLPSCQRRFSACLAAYFSPDPDLIPSCHSSNRLRSRQ